MENNFANRLISARKMAGMSLQSLSDQLNNVVSKQSLHKYEQGKMRPDSELVIAISNVLHIPVNYFYTEPPIEVNFCNLSFRKYSSKLSSSEKESIKEKAKEIFERYFELDTLLNFENETQYFVYDKTITTSDDTENAAIQLRKIWDLGYDPIPNVIEMLEDKGYKVIEVDAPNAFDGFKADVGDKKVIVLRKTNSDDDIVQKRFTALHELAHHVLRFAENKNKKEIEKLCNSFASALLYPAEMVRKELQNERFHFYQNELQLIKERWGISFSAALNRALQLGVITNSIYKKFNINYRSLKYDLPNNEPGRFPGKEKPVRLERLVYIGLAKEVLTINEAAYFAGISAWELRSQMNQLV